VAFEITLLFKQSILRLEMSWSALLDLANNAIETELEVPENAWLNALQFLFQLVPDLPLGLGSRV
jgi:hypothetical protein